jgi:hypothetical protein
MEGKKMTRVEEMTTQKYGPNTASVELFIARLKVLSVEEVKGITARRASRDPRAWNPARNPARRAAWDETLDPARRAAWDAAWDALCEVPSIVHWEAVWIVTAVLVMDLITEEHFTTLTEPFAEILVELGIVWECSDAEKWKGSND